MQNNRRIVNEIVRVIKNNQMPFGYTEGQKLDWSLFKSQTKDFLLKNGKEVYDEVISAIPQISDCFAYDDCFYVWYDEYWNTEKGYKEFLSRVA